MATGHMNPQPAIATLSNAMDVGHPSNFVRILEIFGHQFPELARRLSAVSISDEETTRVIGEVFGKNGYMLDPHGAVGFLALQRYLAEHPGLKGMFLETAHPVKFPETVEKHTGVKPAIPAEVGAIMARKKVSQPMKASYAELRQYLLEQR